MQAISSTDFRKNFSKTLDKVIDDCEPVIVVRNGKRPTVHMSLDHYNSLLETLHLTSSPRNAARLSESLAQLDRGEVIETTMAHLRALEDG